jgi:Winged helix-turn helix
MCPVLHYSSEVNKKQVNKMKRTQLLEETRKMRFEEAYEGWQQKRFTQAEAARLLGMCERSFRRYLLRYEAEGLEGLIDKRLHQLSHLRAPVDEVLSLTTLYGEYYRHWNIKHFYHFYRHQHQGTRSYTWVKNTLQQEGLAPKSILKGKHRKRRERSPLPGMMIHQDGSTHEWIAGHQWDLIITLDDATNEHYSMFFVQQEGTLSSFQGVKETIEKKGLFCSFYSDRGSHYWTTTTVEAGIDKNNLTQFGRAMKHLGIEMIPAYSPQARGRCERMFRTHQARLPQELAAANIRDMNAANAYVKNIYLPAFNAEFALTPTAEGSAFVPWSQSDLLEDILCEQFERTVGNDNTVRFNKRILQIPKTPYRCHYYKVKVRVHHYANGELALFHGPRRLALYDNKGKLKQEMDKVTQTKAA